MLPAARRHLCGRRGKHLGRVAAAVLRIGVGKHLADVGQRGRAEQRVGHGMQQHVGIAVADQLQVTGHVDAAQPQRPARLAAMRVFADPDPQIARGDISQSAVVRKLANPRGLYRRGKQRTTRADQRAGTLRAEILESLAPRCSLLASLRSHELDRYERCFRGRAGQADVEPHAVVQHLHDLEICRRPVGHLGLDLRQHLKRRTESDVQRGDLLARCKFSQQHAMHGFAARGQANPRQLLQQLARRVVGINSRCTRSPEPS